MGMWVKISICNTRPELGGGGGRLGGDNLIIEIMAKLKIDLSKTLYLLMVL